MRLALGALGLLLAAALATDAAAQQRATQFDGKYTGELILTSTIKGDCTEPPLGSLYPLTISGGEVRFAYLPRFATTLIGRIADNGVFQASAVARHGRVLMSGRVQGLNLTATITSPSCHYTYRAKY